MNDFENNKARTKHSKSEHHKNIFKISINQQIFNSNQPLNSNRKINENENSVKRNLFQHETHYSAVHKSQSTAIIQSKFYPPIAEINLNGTKGEVIVNYYFK